MRVAVRERVRRRGPEVGDAARLGDVELAEPAVGGRHVVGELVERHLHEPRAAPERDPHALVDPAQLLVERRVLPELRVQVRELLDDRVDHRDDIVVVGSGEPAPEASRSSSSIT